MNIVKENSLVVLALDGRRVSQLQLGMAEDGRFGKTVRLEKIRF